jgi:hypothetical protein
MKTVVIVVALLFGVAAAITASASPTFAMISLGILLSLCLCLAGMKILEFAERNHNGMKAMLRLAAVIAVLGGAACVGAERDVVACSIIATGLFVAAAILLVGLAVINTLSPATKEDKNEKQ